MDKCVNDLTIFKLIFNKHKRAHKHKLIFSLHKLIKHLFMQNLIFYKLLKVILITVNSCI